ncbi:MAG: MarR family winged helix-turn-helix transcriptional regulator [Candidatus Izemoplasmataceae bacterium]|jgi:MarR family transcriptional regulator, organic hydroperoxide resistance regulator
MNKTFDDCCLEDVSQTVQELVRVLQIFERDEIKPLGFTTSQCYTLIHLKNNPHFTMQALSEKMNLDKSTMTRILNILERDGYLLRYKDQNDRRVVMARLTEKGLTATTQIESSIHAYYLKIVENLPKGQVEDVLKAVSTLIDAFKKANPSCC